MLRKFLPQSVKARLMSLIGFSFCLLISATVLLTAVERKKTFLQAEELRLEARFTGVQKAFEDEASAATAMALVVAAMPDVQTAFGLRNREQLSHLTLPFFKKGERASFSGAVSVSPSAGNFFPETS